MTLNFVCRNMCQRHQNWFAEYLSAWVRRRRYMQRLVRTVPWHSETFQIIVTQCCMFALPPWNFLRTYFKNHPVKMSRKKESVYSFRGITHFGAKIYEYPMHKGSFSGRAKVMLYLHRSGLKWTSLLRHSAAYKRKFWPERIYHFTVKAVPKFSILCSSSMQAFKLTFASDVIARFIIPTSHFEITE